MREQICPYCGRPMEPGFLQTGGGTAAFVKKPRTLLLREDRGDLRLPVSRLDHACPAAYCAGCKKLIVSLDQESCGARPERAARGEL